MVESDLQPILLGLKKSDPEFAVTFEILLAGYTLRKSDAADRWRLIFSNLEAQFRAAGKRTRWAERRRDNAAKEDDGREWRRQDDNFDRARAALLQIGNRLEAMRKLGEAFNGRYVTHPTDLLDHKTRRQVLARNTDLGPTPETFIKPGRVPPVVGMYESGHIDNGHLKAAREIAWVVETVTKLVGCRAKDLESSGGGGFRDSSSLPITVAEIFSQRYAPWVRDQRNLTRTGLRCHDLVIGVVVEGWGVLAARKRYHLGYERAVSYIRLGLTDYWELMERDHIAQQKNRQAEQEATV